MIPSLPLVAGVAGLLAGLWGGWSAAGGVAWGLAGGLLALRLHLRTARALPRDPVRARRLAAAGALGRVALRVAFLATALILSPACFAGAIAGLFLPPALLAYHACRA